MGQSTRNRRLSVWGPLLSFIVGATVGAHAQAWGAVSLYLGLVCTLFGLAGLVWVRGLCLRVRIAQRAHEQLALTSQGDLHKRVEQVQTQLASSEKDALELKAEVLVLQKALEAASEDVSHFRHILEGSETIAMQLQGLEVHLKEVWARAQVVQASLVETDPSRRSVLALGENVDLLVQKTSGLKSSTAELCQRAGGWSTNMVSSLDHVERRCGDLGVHIDTFLKLFSRLTDRLSSAKDTEPAALVSPLMPLVVSPSTQTRDIDGLRFIESDEGSPRTAW